MAFTPEKRKAILDCAEQILRQSKSPTPERAAQIEEMKKKLELSESEVVEAAIGIVAP